jgi:hypothetical protein
VFPLQLVQERTDLEERVVRGVVGGGGGREGGPVCGFVNARRGCGAGVGCGWEWNAGRGVRVGG